MSEEYRVQLDVFSGPLDLLLYLIRRDELDIQDIPLARLTGQYLDYVRLLEQIDPNTAGDFLVMASTLVELKSRALLPTPPLEDENEDDPRTILVKQLLEYKRFKDAAAALGSAADERAKRYARVPADLPKELEGVELEEAQVWDLLTAFGRVMTAIGQGPGFHQVVYDDTPVEEHKLYLLDLVEHRGTLKFLSIFDALATRAEIIGVFLALLELIRARQLRAEQDTLHGEIYLFRIEEVPQDEEAAEENDAPESSAALAPDRANRSATPRLVAEEADDGVALDDDVSGATSAASTTENGSASHNSTESHAADEAATSTVSGSSSPAPAEDTQSYGPTTTEITDEHTEPTLERNGN